MSLRPILLSLIVLTSFAQPMEQKKNAAAAVAQEVPSPNVPGTVTIPQPYLTKSEGAVPPASPWVLYSPFVASFVSMVVALWTVFVSQRNSRMILQEQNTHAIHVAEQKHKHEADLARSQRRAEWKRDFYVSVAEILCVLSDEIYAIHLNKKYFDDTSLDIELRSHWGKVTNQKVDLVNSNVSRLTGHLILSKSLVSDESYQLLRAFKSQWIRLFAASEVGKHDAQIAEMVVLVAQTLDDLTEACARDTD